MQNRNAETGQGSATQRNVSLYESKHTAHYQGVLTAGGTVKIKSEG
jgi:hypothetical protein